MKTTMFGKQEEKKLPDGMDVQIVTAIKTDTQAMREKAAAFVVKDQATYTEANAISEECTRRMKRIDERFADLEVKTKAAKAATDAARSEFLATIRELKEPYEAMRKILDGKAYSWQDTENKRLAAEAEAKRQAEQKRLDDLKEKKVAALENAGLHEEALAVELAPEVAEVPVEKVETSKGSTPRANWKAVLFDMDALLKAIVAGTAPKELVEFNQSFADQLAKSQKAAMRIDGVIARDVGIVSHKVN